MDPHSIVSSWIVQIATAIVGVVLGIASVWYTVKPRHRKQLSFELADATPLLSIGDQVAAGIRLLYRGEAVHNVQVLRIRIANVGNTPIMPSDYDGPLRIEFGDGVTVLAAETTGGVATIGAEVERGRLVPIGLAALQPNQVVDVRVLIAGYSGKVSLTGRVVGVKEITRMDSSQFAISAGFCTMLVVGGIATLVAGLFVLGTTAPLALAAASLVAALTGVAANFIVWKGARR